MKENLLVSACLVGENCRYNKKVMTNDAVVALRKEYHLILVCPEVMGGLAVPRLPAEQYKGKVLNSVGEDLTKYFERGAQKAAELALQYKCKKAVLKERSPSCGCGEIYDGTFSGNLISGNGVTAEMLLKLGLEVIGESKVNKISK